MRECVCVDFVVERTCLTSLDILVSSSEGGGLVFLGVVSCSFAVRMALHPSKALIFGCLAAHLSRTDAAPLKPSIVMVLADGMVLWHTFPRRPGRFDALDLSTPCECLRTSFLRDLLEPERRLRLGKLWQACHP